MRLTWITSLERQVSEMILVLLPAASNLAGG